MNTPIQNQTNYDGLSVQATNESLSKKIKLHYDLLFISGLVAIPFFIAYFIYDFNDTFLWISVAAFIFAIYNVSQAVYYTSKKIGDNRSARRK